MSTHGAARRSGASQEYKIWCGIKQRCNYPKSASFSRYGGRGIKICKKWTNSFAAFLAYVGPRPSPEHTIDRIDSDGDYKPGNVRWATRLEQGCNTRRNRFIEFNGHRQHLAAWARETGLPEDVLAWRLDHYRWTVEEAFTTPVGLQGRKRSA